MKILDCMGSNCREDECESKRLQCSCPKKSLLIEYWELDQLLEILKTIKDDKA